MWPGRDHSGDDGPPRASLRDKWGEEHRSGENSLLEGP